MIANIYAVCTLPIYKRFLYSESIVHSFWFEMVTPSSPQMSGDPNDFLNKKSEHTAPPSSLNPISCSLLFCSSQIHPDLICSQGLKNLEVWQPNSEIKELQT